MEFVRNSLFARSTTMFGVCEALGEDLKVSPTWFRIAFAVGVIFNVEYALAAYAVAAMVVLISRYAYPPRRAASVVETAPAVQAEIAQPVQVAPVLAQAA